MDGQVRDRVADWSERAIQGLDGLRDLAGEDFSGVVEAAGGEPWFPMLNGTILGVHGGGIDDFESREAVARPAPEPGVALLIAMLAGDARPEERYYTEDTPVSQAHETLSSGGFSGYLELSENVLSGDYYVAYYGDRATPVAFVGSSDRLITGDEALERADDEVGIYHVYSVDLEVIDIPGGDGTTADPVVSDAPDEAVTGRDSDPGPDPAPGGDPDPDPDTRVTGDDPDPDPDPATSGDPRSPHSSDDTTDRPGADAPAGEPSSRRTGADADGRTDGATTYGSSTGYGSRLGHDRSRRSAGGGPTENETADTNDGDAPARDDPGTPDSRPADAPVTDGAPADPETNPDADGSRRTDAAGPGGETRSPADTGRDRRDPGGATGDAPHGADDRPDARTDEPGGTGRDPGDATGDAPLPADERTDARPDDGETGAGVGNAGTDRGRGTPAGGSDPGQRAGAATADLRERLDAHERRLDRLRERAAALEETDERAASERRGLRGEVDEMAEELSDLRRTVVRLDETVERLESSGAGRGTTATATATNADAGTGTDTAADSADATGERDADGDDGATTAEQDLSTAEALAETTLLLRYGSRGEPTLEAAHDDDDVGRAAVEKNLRVDVHTPFDDRATTVEGRPFREFIEGRIEYRFFEWLVRDLLFEVRETGNATALEDLYDALPSIDRAELHTTVVVEGDEEEDDQEVEFDVVVRDAHERPLVVARFNASRDPATEEMVVGLRDSASVVGEDADLAAAFSVTESYFSGTARDAAEEATADSILSRNSKESYVKLSRKRGYHLCLVAVGSDEEFHLRVPDL